MQDTSPHRAPVCCVVYVFTFVHGVVNRERRMLYVLIDFRSIDKMFLDCRELHHKFVDTDSAMPASLPLFWPSSSSSSFEINKKLHELDFASSSSSVCLWRVCFFFFFSHYHRFHAAKETTDSIYSMWDLSCRCGSTPLASYVLYTYIHQINSLQKIVDFHWEENRQIFKWLWCDVCPFFLLHTTTSSERQCASLFSSSSLVAHRFR